MKLSQLDSRELANKGVACHIYHPKTGEKTGATFTLLGSDSAVYKAKTKELHEKHRLEGEKLTQESAEADAIEILAVCITGWDGVVDENDKPLAFTRANVIAALEIPEIYRQVGEFAMRRANFLPSGSAS